MTAPILAFLLVNFLAGVVLRGRMPVTPPLFALIRGAGRWFDRRLNRTSRRKKDLALRGLVVTALLLSAVLGLYNALPMPGGDLRIVAHTVLLLLTASFMGPLNLLRGVAKALKAKDTPRAAALLRPHVRMPADESDAAALARQGVEWSAITLNAWLTGPLLFGLAFGAEGVLVYCVIAALRGSIAADDVPHAYFGLVPRWLGDALNLFSGAVTTVIIALASIFVANAHPLQALRTTAARKLNYPRGTGEWPIAALAGALHVTLAGPPWDWLGPEGSSARVTPDEIERSALLHFVCFLCVMALVSGGILLAHFPQFVKINSLY